MKAFSGFMALLALSMFANAIDNRWAFVPSHTGTKWVVLDIVIGLLFAVVSYVAYVSAERSELMRSVGTRELYRQEQERIERSSETPATSADRPDDT